jgi:hypothetical protein
VPDQPKYYRIRSNFAVIYAGAALAIDYGVLPWKKGPTFWAINDCMTGALKQLGECNSDPQNGNVAVQPLLLALKNLLAKSALVAVTPKKRANGAETKRRQDADGFRIGNEILLKGAKLKQWFPDEEERSALIGCLEGKNVLRRSRPDTPTIEKKISGIHGKPRYYVLDNEQISTTLKTEVPNSEVTLCP